MTALVNLHTLPPGAARRPEALTERWGDRWLYIGREVRHYYLPQSQLANPYHIGRNGRQESVDLYRAWLWDAINTPVAEVLVELAKVKDDTVLLCWCAPEPCHGDVVIAAARWLHKQSWFSVPILIEKKEVPHGEIG